MSRFNVKDKVKWNGNKAVGWYYFDEKVEKFLTSKEVHIVTSTGAHDVHLEGSEDLGFCDSWLDLIEDKNIDELEKSKKLLAKITMDTSKLNKCMEIYTLAIESAAVAFEALQQAMKELVDSDNVKVEVE